jgi:hypothetical protein
MAPRLTGFDRRSIIKSIAASSALAATPLSVRNGYAQARPYEGPNVIVVRFGGGVRRRETINIDHTFSPYFAKVMAPKGALFRNVMIDGGGQTVTSHAQGTLFILTGRYDEYKEVGDRFLGERFEPNAPTLFEYLRKSYAVPEHQALIINGEDRGDEDFLTFSTNNHYGVSYRSRVLSLHQFKAHVLRRRLADFQGGENEHAMLQKQLAEMNARDYRGAERHANPEISRFWDRWREHYGDTGFKNPRGDRLLTALALRALKELKPRLMLINYQDPDYVHWGNASHYTRGVSVIDEGLKQLTEFVDGDAFYGRNTIFAVVPDCGRDDNAFMQVPYQHHFNTKSSREIFAFLMGPGVKLGLAIDDPVEQIGIAKTIGGFMGFDVGLAEGSAFEAAFA